MPDHTDRGFEFPGGQCLMERPSARSIVTASIVVFAVALLLRIPSCYESFWVDELHSAWCVWDNLADVPARAEIGHQSPF